MHRILVASAARHLNTTELGVFVRAYVAQPGSPVNITEAPANQYRDYVMTGNAPEYVQVYATRQVEAARFARRRLAAVIPQGTLPDLSDMSIAEVNNSMEARGNGCPGQRTFFDEDGA